MQYAHTSLCFLSEYIVNPFVCDSRLSLFMFLAMIAAHYDLALLKICCIMYKYNVIETFTGLNKRKKF